MKSQIIIHNYESPRGELVLGSFGDRLCMCDWANTQKHEANRRRIARLLGADFAEGLTPVIERASAQLNEYFAGLRHDFDVPLLFAGTEFQKKVWETLLTIPYSQTVTYGEMSRITGMPKAVRAVAAAIGANAISVIVPCHRVTGSNGVLTGYAGGLEAKCFLLEHENQTSRTSQTSQISLF